MTNFSNTLIQQLADLLPWAEKLSDTAYDIWLKPIAAGKWAPREILTHILNWDRNSLEVMLPHILNGARLSFVDIEKHNQSAVILAQQYYTLDELIHDVVTTRRQFIEALASQYDETTRFTIDGHPYTYSKFIEIFTDHDRHHRKQIEAVLNVK